MAFQETQESPACSSQHTVALNRFLSIVGAGRLKAARGREKWRDPSLVEGDYSDAELPHGTSRQGFMSPSRRRAASQVSRRCRNETLRASRLGNTIISRPATRLGRTSRDSSRKRRFARFLVTASPRRFPTTIPTRQDLASGEEEGQETRLKNGV